MSDYIYYDTSPFFPELTPEQSADSGQTSQSTTTTQNVGDGNVTTQTTTVSTKVVPAKDYTSKLIQGNKIAGADLNADDLVNVVVPYARAATINFSAKKLKPNTKFYAFFDEYNVTDFCICGNVTANISGFSTTTIQNDGITSEAGNIYSNYKGEVSGVFTYNPSIDFKVPSGKILFRLTDSPTNGEDKESFADAYYISNGYVNNISPERANYSVGNGSYGSGGTTIPNNSGGNTSTANPVTGSGSTNASGVGFLEEALGFVLNIAPSSITTQQLSTYAQFYTSFDPNFVFDESLFKFYAPGNTYDYDTTSVDRSNYNFANGTQAGSGKTSTGIDYSKYLTATNILGAVNSSTGNYFVDDVKTQIVSVGGQGAWDNAVMPAYNGLVSTVTDIVAKNTNYNALPADMKAFWETGIKNGTYKPNDQSSVDLAIKNYAAAVTLGYLDQSSTKARSTSTNTKNNGLSYKI